VIFKVSESSTGAACRHPGLLVDFVVVADKYTTSNRCTDPRHIKPVHVYVLRCSDGDPRYHEKHNVRSLNNGIGFNTAAIS
jgi:malonate decarboxylase alpha subunit